MSHLGHVKQATVHTLNHEDPLQWDHRENRPAWMFPNSLQATPEKARHLTPGSAGSEKSHLFFSGDETTQHSCPCTMGGQTVLFTMPVAVRTRVFHCATHCLCHPKSRDGENVAPRVDIFVIVEVKRQGKG